MRRLPGEPGDYAWIAVGLAMIAAGLWPFLMGTDDGGQTTYAEHAPDAPDGELSIPTSTPPPDPRVPTLPDITTPPLPVGNDTLA